MPSLRSLLNEIQAELDSRQIVVAFKTTPEGVVIEAEDYASKLIARHELNRWGIPYIEIKPLELHGTF